jgi:hypothetical protein
MKNGDLELPNVQDKINANPRYLEDTLRIENLVKEYVSHDNKEKIVNKAVNDLSMSMFKD